MEISNGILSGGWGVATVLPYVIHRQKVNYDADKKRSIS